MEKPSAICRRHAWSHDGVERWEVWFICPGCREAHAFDHRWTFNGDFDRPTIEPSFLTWNDPNPSAISEPFISGRRCHSYIVDGNMQFLSDCTHPLAGQTVAIPPWADDQAFGKES